jgi:hypothetical protein
VIIGVVAWLITVGLLWGSLCFAIISPRWNSNFDIWGLLSLLGISVGAVALGSLIVVLGGLSCDFVVFKLKMADWSSALRASQWRIRLLYVSAIANIASATCACFAMTWDSAFLVAAWTQGIAACAGLAVGTWIVNRARSTLPSAVLVTLLGGVLLLIAGAVTAYWIWGLREAYGWWVLPVSRGSAGQ